MTRSYVVGAIIPDVAEQSQNHGVVCQAGRSQPQYARDDSRGIDTHGVFICVYMCGKTRSYPGHGASICAMTQHIIHVMTVEGVTRMPWRIYICSMCVQWLVHTRAMAHLYLCRDSSQCAHGRGYDMHVMAHLYMFMCVHSLIHTHAIAHWYLFTGVQWLIGTLAWPIYMCHVHSTL